MNNEHETCGDESCEICSEREREAVRRYKPGVDRVMRKLKPVVERRRRQPQC